MSEISDRIIRGQYVSKAECFANAEEIERTLDAYPRAMAAMEAEERMMQDCICTIEGGHGADGSGVVRTPKAGCIVHAEEDQDA